LTYFLRVLPPGKIPINFDLGVVQAAGNIASGINLKARHQVGRGFLTASDRLGLRGGPD
jgi:hypothetical protein